MWAVGYVKDIELGSVVAKPQELKVLLIERVVRSVLPIRLFLKCLPTVLQQCQRKANDDRDVGQRLKNVFD